MALRSYRDLLVWQKTMDPVPEFYKRENPAHQRTDYQVPAEDEGAKSAGGGVAGLPPALRKGFAFPTLQH
jgi:hypothetical protein